MTLMSHPVSSRSIHSEVIQCKTRHNGVNTFANRVDSARRKETFLCLRSSLWSSLKVKPSSCSAGTGVGRRLRRHVIVGASPPTEDAVISTEPLTKEDLVGYLASGCKPKENWRIGTEHEKFGFEIGTLNPMKYEQIAELLNVISERFDWDKIMEGENIIGLKQDKQSISLEPGGQFELSGAPLETLHQTCAEVNSHLYQVKAVAEEMGIGFLGIGFQPKWRREDIPIMPKGRYVIMKNYMPKVGSLGLDMMFRTCTVQVNLDFDSEADMIRKFRAGLALQPIATALFANSPFTEGKPNGYLSMRSQIWTDTDNNRAGMLPFVFDDSFGFEQYVEYALDVPMYFVYRQKKYIDCAGLSFRDFLAGKLPSLPGEYPTFNDWENHLTTIFPEVRLKRYLEMRGADGGPWRRLCALPAFWVGLLYDDVSLQNVLDMIADWTPEERQMLRNKVPKSGLKTPFRDGLLKHVAQDVLKFAKDGLDRRGFKETGFLNELTEVVNTGITPAEKLLALYHGKWGRSVDPVFEELLY
ncbi:glutamate--cysteine ligase, chloroplastic-like [Salvia miltiorrhiza]|uniref:glutamate--cysteine ligase, chloroplastic-like n=1 Tax=Salvia miltiorrhiza TaxID=226208 RepID=UPI0025AD43D2|nr:glutamate--cysteine ligase, chloroplastic-like [Salvia miltiorrhiza]XP_057763782.1 glutamate--cysteine ligase, chloroplastic-like [Salvia miltiorrhiza]